MRIFFDLSFCKKTNKFLKDSAKACKIYARIFVLKSLIWDILPSGYWKSMKRYLFLKNKSSREWIIIVWLFHGLHLCVCVCVCVIFIILLFLLKECRDKMTFDLIAWYLLFLRQFGIIRYVLILFLFIYFIYFICCILHTQGGIQNSYTYYLDLKK